MESPALAQVKDWLWIHSVTDIEDVDFYNSMLEADKTFSSIAIGESDDLFSFSFFEYFCDDFMTDPWYLRAVNTIVGITHGDHITCLQLMNVEIRVESLLLLLSYTANLKHLKLYFVSCNKNHVARVKMEANRIPPLTDLILYKCGDSMTQLINYIPENAVKSLTIKVAHFKDLASYFEHQKAIDKLSLMCPNYEQLPADLLKDLKLSHLLLNVQAAEDIGATITGQKTMKTLDLGALVIDGSTFDKILKLKKLNDLTINVAGIEDDRLEKSRDRIEKLISFQKV